MSEEISLQTYLEWLEEEHENDLWFEINGNSAGQLAMHIRALMARIALLEDEVLRIGEVLEMVPIVSLEWPNVGGAPSDFAERLLKGWGKIAREVLTDSLYHELADARDKRASVDGG